MRLFWASTAEQDRADILDHIAQENPRAALRLDSLFAAAAAHLMDHPLLGKPGRVHGTREWFPHESYCLVYEVQGDAIWILALVHTARQWPPRRV